MDNLNIVQVAVLIILYEFMKSLFTRHPIQKAPLEYKSPNLKKIVLREKAQCHLSGLKLITDYPETPQSHLANLAMEPRLNNRMRLRMYSKARKQLQF